MRLSVSWLSTCGLPGSDMHRFFGGSPGIRLWKVMKSWSIFDTGMPNHIRIEPYGGLPSLV